MNRREFLGAAAALPAVARTGATESTVRWQHTMDGTWQFHPEHTLAAGLDPRSPQLRDETWPEIDVPNFWRPNEYWLWDAKSKASMKYVEWELERVRKYRFDPFATRAGWYRRWIEVPREAEGKRLFVKFWAVAMIAEVWWNGERVGSHLGMFGPFECELTRAAKPGMNLLTVFVAGGRYAGRGDMDALRSRGVTVDVSSPWLDDLPQSCYWMCGKEGGGGIWQSVSVYASDAARIADVFFQPKLDGGRVSVTVDSSDGGARELRYTVSDFRTGQVLTQEARPVPVTMAAGEPRTLDIDLGRVSPKLWSPEDPNLYWLAVELWDGRRKSDEIRHAVGFRTFEVRGTNFHLNGKPYFLRGATMPPYGIAPWDSDLAFRYFELLRAGNEMFSAYNETGANDIWCHAADVTGIGMLDQGAWTWALQGASDPPKELIDAWKQMHAEMVLSVRNHPSILLRSINDEAWFHYLPPRALGCPPDRGRYFDPNRERRLRKWQIVSEVVKMTRRLDPTRPVGASGGYSRTAEEWKDLAPLGIDDGDFDNIHVFNGTYGPSYLPLDVRRDIERRYSMGGRPLISDQAGTGYPDNDIGFATDAYVQTHRVTQAWVGEYVYDQRMPFLDVNGQIIKEGYEKVRRDKGIIGGWMMFSNCQWFRDVWNAHTIAPYPQIYDCVARALEPVLVSLGNPNRHFKAGEVFRSAVCVVHDDIRRDRLNDLHVRWTWAHGAGNVLGQGDAALPDLDYYGTSRTTLEFEVPKRLPAPLVRGRLRLDLLSSRQEISWNEYPALIAAERWTEQASGPARHPDLVTITPPARLSSEEIGKLMERGATVLFLRPSPEQAQALGIRAEAIPQHMKSHIWDTPDGPWGAEYVQLDKHHPLAAGLDPVYDMRWWNADDAAGPRVADAVLSSPDGKSGDLSILGARATPLCTYVAPHGYYNAPWDFQRLFPRPVLVEASIGKGTVIVSTLRAAADPIARRFQANLVRYATYRGTDTERIKYF